VQVQVVFQGGGAKLVALMAVCEVLEEYENSKISITRVAGSSAGAIAAAMLASNRPVRDFIDIVKAVANRHLRHLDYSYLGAFFRVVLLGSSIFPNVILENVFEELFCSKPAKTPGGGTKTERQLRDFRFEVRAYHTDLYSLNAVAASAEASIPQALADSCRFPLAFSGFKTKDIRVDGGLAVNLPVDELQMQESTMGRVIAISFEPTFGKVKQHSLKRYVEQLFSAGIQSGVERSERILGSANVFKIATDIGTFDFAAAIDEGLDRDAIEAVKARFRVWLDEWLRPHVVQHQSRHVIRPSLSSTPIPEPLILELDRHLKFDTTIRAVSVKSYEVALFDDQGRFNGKYRTSIELGFVPLRPVHLLQFDCEFKEGGRFEETETLCSCITAEGQSTNFTISVQKAPTPSPGMDRYRIFFMFKEPLVPEPSERAFFAQLKYIAGDPYPKLGTGTEGSTLARWQGTTDLLEIAVAFPRSKFNGRVPKIRDIAEQDAKELERIGWVNEGETISASVPMAMPEFLGRMQLESAADRYILVGRRAVNLKQREAVGFVID
jgi:NTE family protein